MPHASTYRIRKIYRGLARIRGSGSLPWLMLFVRRENVVRLLEFLGVPSARVAEFEGR